MKSIIDQQPATKNQIISTKPNVINSANILQGYISSSTNGGIIRPVAYAQIMAGTKVYEHRIRLNIKMLTPKTPAYQKLKGTIKAYFVPNVRVMTNYDKFYAQKGGAQETKIEELPNLGGYQIPMVYNEPSQNPASDTAVIFTDTDIFRDSYVSCYIKRFQTGEDYEPLRNNEPGHTEALPFRTLPKISALPLRGFKAIYNDFERNKEYDEPLREYKTDNVSTQEFESYFSVTPNNVINTILRGKRQNSYYTDYRTELLGINEEYNFEESNNTLSSLIEYQKLVSEARNEAENAQLNDWDIIAKLHGTRRAQEGQVQLLGVKTFGLNYQPITQSAYNTNENIQEDFQVLGEQGAYSYTEIDMPIYGTTEFIQDGYVHFILQVSADSVFETGIDRILLNVKALDQYRPDLKELKDDVLYDIEKSAIGLTEESQLTQITGYKRKFSEYFKLPDSISGDITRNGYVITTSAGTEKMIGRLQDITSEEGYRLFQKTISKGSFQFFETSDKYFVNEQPEGNIYSAKKIWKDYTDVLINENQAIKQRLEVINNERYNDKIYRIIGDNQLIMLGIQTMVADLPIDENIKNNYTTWGEM